MIRTKTQPAPEPVQETRQRIVREAERLFYERGYKGVSMAAIAEAVGHTPAALYYHFPAKEDIFLAVLEKDIAARTAAIRAAFTNNSSFAARLEAIAYVLLTTSCGGLPTMLRDAHEHIDRQRFEACLHTAWADFDTLLGAFFDAAKAEGVCSVAFATADLTPLLVGMSIGIGGDPLHSRAALTEADHRRHAATIARVFLHGMTP